MSRFIRVLSLLLVIVTVVGVPVFAVEIGERASDFFVQSRTYIDVSGSTLDIWFDVTAKSTMQELGASEIKVQQSSDGSTWTTVATYTKASYTNLICKNTVAHADHVTYTAASGYYYRAKTTFYAKNSTGTAEMTHYTSSVTVGQVP